VRFDLVTIFPEAFDSPLRVSLLGKAIDSGLVEVEVHDLRRWGQGVHRKVDDQPFGGGAGMIMAPGPLVEAIRSVRRPGGRVLLLSAAGRVFDHALAAELAGEQQVVLVCGRYEGVDERVAALVGAETISIGDFVLAGGESAAVVVIEAVARLVPGVLGNLESLAEESFTGGLLEYPQYTRPAVLEGQRVPEVLLSGDHGRIARWRREQALRRTFELRPELLVPAELSDEERGHAKGIMSFWLDHSPRPLQAEQVVADPELGVAGRFDLRAALHGTYCGEPLRGAVCLVDAKTGGYRSEKEHAQLSGYDLLAETCGIGASDRLFILQVFPDGRYRLIEGQGSRDSFLHAVATYRDAAAIRSASKKERARVDAFTDALAGPAEMDAGKAAA